jgi:hypothetical protein
VQRGADWFKAIGTDERNTGPKLYAVSGHVERPGTYEHPIGITFRELLESCGGMYKGRALKAWIPGGASAAMLTAEHLDMKLDFDSLAKAGSMLGSAAVIVMDETTCVVRATAAPRQVLRPRVVRPVHTLPRGHQLDASCSSTRIESGTAPRATSTCCQRRAQRRRHLAVRSGRRRGDRSSR